MITRDLNFYIDLAKERTGIKSDRKMSEHLGLKFVAVNSYRSARAFPSDDVMVRLAVLAGIDPAVALMDLNSWRTPPSVKNIYEEIREKMISSNVLVLVFISLISFSSPAQSSTNINGLCHRLCQDTVSYGN